MYHRAFKLYCTQPVIYHNINPAIFWFITSKLPAHYNEIDTNASKNAAQIPNPHFTQITTPWSWILTCRSIAKHNRSHIREIKECSGEKLICFPTSTSVNGIECNHYHQHSHCQYLILGWQLVITDQPQWWQIRNQQRRRRAWENSNENKMTAEDKINHDDDGWKEKEEEEGQVLRAGRGLICQSTPVSLKKVCTVLALGVVSLKKTNTIYKE